MSDRKSYSPIKIVSVVLILFLLGGAAVFTPARAVADDAMDAQHLAERATLTLETFSSAPRWRRLETSSRMPEVFLSRPRF